MRDLGRPIFYAWDFSLKSDVEDTADIIMMIKKGQIVRSGSYEDIVQKSDGTYYDGIEAAYMDCFEEKN